ncbi:cytochrome P450 [Arthrobacter sp. R1-13]
MATSLSDFLAEHPVDRTQVDAHKRRIVTAIEEFRRVYCSADGINEECRA